MRARRVLYARRPANCRWPGLSGDTGRLAADRARFLQASADEGREDCAFCRVLYFSGCRPSEVLELTPERISLDERAVAFRSLKKRKSVTITTVKPTRFEVHRRRFLIKIDYFEQKRIKSENKSFLLGMHHR